MLSALENEEYRELAWRSLPRIVDVNEPLGPLAANLALECGIPEGQRPLIFPTLDDQAAGLIGGGAVEDGQVAIILGTSAVVNSSSNRIPESGTLDVMKLNWGPFLWMRCYSNGAQFIRHLFGNHPNWDELEAAARKVPPASGAGILPFFDAEPSRNVHHPRLEWYPREPEEMGVRYRVCLEALAYLIALGVEEHQKAGQKTARITVSGGMARSALMVEILASVLNRDLELLQSDEGPALGAAVMSLSAIETFLRRRRGDQEPFSAADAVTTMVRFRSRVQPNPEWRKPYSDGLDDFRKRL
jgi:sugar (pentulose or hexulose) kinase